MRWIRPLACVAAVGAVAAAIAVFGAQREGLLGGAAAPSPAPSPWGEVPVTTAGGALETSSGLVLPVVADHGDGSYEVRTPCDATATASGAPLTGAHVVLDPGHGGEEPGAVGANGLREADLNLDVAQRVATILREQGATVVLTRDSDVRVTVATRAALAVSLQPQAFLSIHHNAAPEGPSSAPGTEAYFQLASLDSRRLSGLVVEEVRAALAPLGADWSSDTDNGAKARVRGEDPSQDYYGVLRQSAGITAVLVEAAYLSNPAEADLLDRDDVRQAEAEAIAHALLRFHRGESAADTAYSAAPPSTGGSGTSGGTADGCQDPPL
jgi:N-acetylmuramoyl-L-alanine amidase